MRLYFRILTSLTCIILLVNLESGDFSNSYKHAIVFENVYMYTSSTCMVKGIITSNVRLIEEYPIYMYMYMYILCMYVCTYICTHTMDMNTR